MMRDVRRATLAGMLVLALAPTAAIASGDGEEGGGGPGTAESPQNLFRDEYSADVDPTSGSFTTEVPIEVPDFRGLEPRLALRYSSSAESGIAGVGWRVDGLSFIDRASPGRGVPRYASSDVYTLDDGEMLPCTDLLGNWCPRVQSYERVTRNAGNNTWEVRTPSGLRRVYTAQIGTGGNTFRWALASVSDLRSQANTVDYSYSCTSGKGCYPNTITYNGGRVVVRFHTQVRPDPIVLATGNELRIQDRRLQRVDVTVDGLLLRSYRLFYDAASQNGGRSLLRRVELHGVGASAKRPDTVFTYQDGPGGQYASPQTFSPGGTSVLQQGEFLTGDFDGDGRSDVFYINPLGNFVQLWRATGAQPPFTVTQTSGGASENVSQGYWFTGDIDGDGRTDAVHAVTGKIVIWKSNGDGTFTRHQPTVPGGYPQMGQGRWLAADFDGDGRAELFHADANGGGAKLHVWKHTGNFQFAVTDIAPGYSGIHRGYWLPVDLNGDGMIDLVHASFIGSQRVRVFLANGTSTFFTASNQSPPSGYPDFRFGRWNVGDFNGDGLTDLLHVSWPQGPYRLHVWTGRGDGTFLSPAEIPRPSTSYFYEGWWLPLDLNGDGKTDLVHVSSISSGALNRWLSKGALGEFDRLTPPSVPSGYPSLAQGRWVVGDFDGDGRDDLLHAAENSQVRIWKASGQIGNRMTSSTNRQGGTTTVGYTPSSAWPSAGLPVGMLLHTVTALTRSDGRGNSHTTSYEYGGGAWSSQERCFLGFRDVRRFDAQGNYEHTVSRQSPTCIVRPEVVSLREPRPNPQTEGKRFSSVESEYGDVEEASPPFHVLETRRREFECNLNATCREVRTDRSYDAYANVVRIIEHGVVGQSGDERTTVRQFQPNTAQYIVDRVARERVYPGVVASGTPAGAVADAIFLYDQISAQPATAYTQPPSLGDLRQESRWDDVHETWRNDRYEYDARGNRTKEIDPRGFETVTIYDPTYQIFPTSICNPLNQCTTRDWYFQRGLLKDEWDPNGAQTSFAYDAFGRSTDVTGPDGQVRSIQRLQEGNPAQQRVRVSEPDHTADGLWREVWIDGLSREWRTVREGGSTRLTTYHEDSDRIAQQSLWHKTGSPEYRVHEYDGADRLKSVREPTSLALTSYTYDNGFVTRTDPLAKQRTTWSDAYGRIERVREWNGGVPQDTFFRYDVLDNLREVEDAGGRLATFQHDSLGRQTVACPFDHRGCIGFVYDAAGLLLSRTDPKGQTLAFTYDELGRRRTKLSPAGLAEWFYDEPGHGASIGRLTRVAYPGGSESYSWNLLGLETEGTRCVDSRCLSVAKTYDEGRRLETLGYPDGEVMTYRYHAEGHLEELVGYVDLLTRNARGQLETVSYANGTVASFLYANPHKLLSSATVTGPAGTLYEASYGYNLSRRITSLTSTTHPQWNLVPSYDDLHRLTGVTGGQSQTLDYDAVGNVTVNTRVAPPSQPCLYDDPDLAHALTRAGESHYAYDANGNVMSVTERVPGCVTPMRLLTWDAEDRLSAVIAGGLLTRYGYDADGQRIRKQVGSQVRRTFGNLVEVTREGGQESVTKYYYADGLLVAQRTDGAVRFVHQDHLDSLRVVSDATGQGAATREYAPFGEEVGASGSVALTRGYGGHWNDGESGLLYLGGRYYDPVVARFVQPDPLVPEPGDPQSWNAYSFVRNDPLNRVDPSGNIDLGAYVGGRVTAHFGGNQKAGELFGSLGASVVPGVGELADLGVIFSLDHRIGTGQRLLAVGSLVANLATGGLAPNVGSAARHADELAEGVATAARTGDVAADATRGGGITQRAATREAKRQAGIPTSQQAASQTSQRASDGTKVGRQQTFETPSPGGGTQTKSVQVSRDQVGKHAGQPQIEAGNVKSGGQVDSAGRPRIQNEGKVRVDF